MVTRALIVGIEIYEQPRNNLLGVSNDVEAMLRILAKFGLPSLQTVVLRDADATCERIKFELQQLVQHASEEDVCIFYYSGHGLEVPVEAAGARHEALVPHDGSYRNLIMDQWMAEFLRGGAAKCSFWGIYDACHSGQIYKDWDEQTKSFEFDELIDDSSISAPPAFVGLSPQVDFKEMILDGAISKAIHIAAVGVKQKAIVKTIETTRRSVFTWALEEVISPHLKVSGLEKLITAKQNSIAKDLEAHVGVNHRNQDVRMFSALS